MLDLSTLESVALFRCADGQSHVYPEEHGRPAAEPFCGRDLEVVEPGTGEDDICSTCAELAYVWASDGKDRGPTNGKHH